MSWAGYWRQSVVRRLFDVLAHVQCFGKCKHALRDVGLVRKEKISSYLSFAKFQATWVRLRLCPSSTCSNWFTCFAKLRRGLYGWLTLKSNPRVWSKTLSACSTFSFCSSMWSWVRNWRWDVSATSKCCRWTIQEKVWGMTYLITYVLKCSLIVMRVLNKEAHANNFFQRFWRLLYFPCQK